MRWLIFGDLHVRETSTYSVIENDGRQTFLHDVDKTFSWLCSLVFAHQIQGIITLGDLTDTTGYVSTQVLASLARGMRSLSDAVNIQNMDVAHELHLVGNHDLLGGLEHPDLHNLAFLKDAISEPAILSFSPSDFVVALPYGSKGWQWGTAHVDFVVAHVEIKEIESALHRREAGVWSLNGFKTRVFLGHYHTPDLSIDVPDNVTIVGTSLPHCFADGDHDPSVVIYDSMRDHVQRVHNPHARRFRGVQRRENWETFKTEERDVIRITVPFETPNSEVDRIKNQPGYIEVVREAQKTSLSGSAPEGGEAKGFALSKLREAGGYLVDLLSLMDLIEEDTSKKIFVEFEWLKAKGYLCIGEVFINLRDQGITEVIGRNYSLPGHVSNASGKSTIFSSIHWCLTGECLRGLTGDDVIGDHTDHVDVSCGFNLTQAGQVRKIVVRRTRRHPDDHNCVQVSVDGQPIQRRLKSLTDEEFLKGIFGVRGKNLLQTTLLTKRRAARFSDLGPTARLQVIEDAARVVSLDEAKKRLAAFASDLGTKLDSTRGSYEASDVSLKQLGDRKVHLEERLWSFSDVQDNPEALEAIRIQIKTTEATIESLKATVHVPGQIDLGEEPAKKAEADTTLMSLAGDISKVSQNIGQMEEMVAAGSCYYCKRPITIEDYRVQLQEAKERLKFLRQRKGQWGSYKQQLDSYTAAKMALHDQKVRKYTRQQTALSNASRELEKLRIREIRLLEMGEVRAKEKASLQGQLENTTNLLRDTVLQAKRYRKALMGFESLDRRVQSLQRLFSAAGLRNDLIEAAVMKFNYYLSNYAALVKSPMTMATKKKKKSGGLSSMVNIKAYGRSLKAASDGQLDRVNLPTQLALRKLSEEESGFSSNMLLLDEVIQSVDGAGVDSIGQLLTASKIPSIFLVAHNPRFSSIADKKLIVENRGEVTSVLEDS